MTPHEENELICEKLLGWKLAGRNAFKVKMWFCLPNGQDGEQYITTSTPSFTTWAQAGLILEALSAKELYPRLEQQRASGHWHCDILGGNGFGCNINPSLAIRAAALETSAPGMDSTQMKW